MNKKKSVAGTGGTRSWILASCCRSRAARLRFLLLETGNVATGAGTGFYNISAISQHFIINSGYVAVSHTALIQYRDAEKVRLHLIDLECEFEAHIHRFWSAQDVYGMHEYEQLQTRTLVISGSNRTLYFLECSLTFYSSR